MIETIVEDSKRSESEASSAEQAAHQGYEEFITDSNKSIKTKSEDIMNKQNEVAKSDQEKTITESDKKSADDKLESLAELERGLHGRCDFLVKNFDERQASLSQEVEALQQSTAILSGSK